MSTQTSSGAGFSTLLFVIFLILKLCEVIDWSWGWVFSPFWIPIVLWLGYIAIWGIILIIAGFFNKKR